LEEEPEEPHPASSQSAPIAAAALRYPGDPMRKLIILFVISLGLLGAAPAQAGIPDLFTGSWPAKLMPSNQELGTITWVPVREAWARGLLNQPWGGAPFTTCPDPGQTRFFFGRYSGGGKLIACTVGPDGRRLHGRYDGSGGEFAPSSFDVSIVEDSPTREFEGVYVEVSGFTTDWCAELIPGSDPDTTAPQVTALPSFGRAGKAVRLGYSASDDRNLVRITATIRRAGKRVATINSGFRRVDGSPRSLVWRHRTPLRGLYTYCIRAYDRYGNTSRLSCTTLRLR